MKVEVVPFEANRFLGDAAALLTREYRRVAAAVRVPRAFMDEAGAAEAITRHIVTGPAVAALCGGRLVGFVGADAGTARIRLSQHQAESPDAREVYRVLYASLSEQLVRMSRPSHSFDVLVACAGVVATWFELGFGVDQVKGVKPAGRTGSNEQLAPGSGRLATRTWTDWSTCAWNCRPSTRNHRSCSAPETTLGPGPRGRFRPHSPRRTQSFSSRRPEPSSWG